MRSPRKMLLVCIGTWLKLCSFVKRRKNKHEYPALHVRHARRHSAWQHSDPSSLAPLQRLVAAPNHAVARPDHATSQPHRLGWWTPACAGPGLCLERSGLGLSVGYSHSVDRKSTRLNSSHT